MCRKAQRARRKQLMKSTHRAGLALLVAASLTAPAYAQNMAKERGNVVSTNWQTMQIELKDPKGRVGTWTVRRDAEVVFTDKKSAFPNPKLADLRAPMYVMFTFDFDSKEIHKLEVIEVGFEPSAGGPGAQQQATITNLDANIGHVEVDMGAGPKTFEVDPKSQLGNFKIGDKVTILIDKQGNKEVVTKISRR
jgi:hypothetical protein